MTGNELLDRLTVLVGAGYGEEEVFIDSNPYSLLSIDDVDIDSDGDGIIIWTA